MREKKYYYNKEFMNRFELAVRKCGKSVSALAREGDTTCTTISNYRYGVSLPNAYSLSMLCPVLGVSADWLLGLSDKGGPEE